MKVNVHGAKRDWKGIWDTIVRIFFIFFFGLACLEAGWILRDFQRDELNERAYKHAARITDHEGRIVALEGPPRGKK